MRTALAALTDELRRLKGAGVKTVAVSADSVEALRSALARSSAGAFPGPAQVPAAGRGGSTSAAPLPQKRVTAPPPTDVPASRAIPPVATDRGAGESVSPPPPVVKLSGADKRERWQSLQEQVLNDPVCRRNVRDGKKVVLGVGSLDARLMFVGEAPGAEEEIQGEPFVGPAGQLLTKMIQAMGMSRGEVYIGNIMNWRPQLPVDADGVQFGNRPPTADELAYCLPYLKAQIEVVAPGFLVALGATAAQGLLGAGAFKALGEVRGRWHTFQGLPLMITYHPSYILRNNSNRSKRLIWEDLLQVMDKAGLPVSDRQRGYFLDK